MVIFYCFNLQNKPEYHLWAKLRGKLYATGNLPKFLDDPFKIAEGENWGIFKFSGGIAGYYFSDVILPRVIRHKKSNDPKTERAVEWMYAAPFRTYEQTAARFKLHVTQVKRAALKYRQARGVKVDPVQDVIDLLMAEYLVRPLHYTLAEYAARYGLTAGTIRKRICATYSPAEWPGCIQQTKRALAKCRYYK